MKQVGNKSVLATIGAEHWMTGRGMEQSVPQEVLAVQRLSTRVMATAYRQVIQFTVSEERLYRSYNIN